MREWIERYKKVLPSYQESYLDRLGLVREKETVRYPTLEERKSRQAPLPHALYRRVNELVGSRIDPQLREDVIQDIIVRVLSGEVRWQDIVSFVRSSLPKIARQYQTAFKSADTTLSDEGTLRMVDLMDTDTYQERWTELRARNNK